MTSCSEYQKLLKSTDPELKYDKAVEYFQAKKYDRAISLFSDITTYYRSTDRAELIINYLAKAHIEKKDYITAAEYYDSYNNAYPRGTYIEEVKFMLAFCHYKESPDVRLDQTSTYSAIAAFQNFIDQFPRSDRVEDANKYIAELNDKLAYKELLNARLYHDMGLYLGNNYLSAVVTAENALKRFPATKYREDFMIVVLKAKFQQSLYSEESLKLDRYQSTIDEAYTYLNEYPEGKYVSQAKNILATSQKNIPDFED